LKDRDLFFKLEGGKPALLLHLPVLIAETAVFDSAFGLGCILVVATPQGFQCGNMCICARSWRSVALPETTSIPYKKHLSVALPRYPLHYIKHPKSA
jgi:hypothetical protein